MNKELHLDMQYYFRYDLFICLTDQMNVFRQSKKDYESEAK